MREQLLKGDSLSQAILFESLLPNSPGDISVEIFDRTRRLAAWAGSRGPSLDPQQIAGRESSFVLEGPLYSYLIVSVPVEYRNTVCGFVIGKQLFDVNYPINNRFINNEAFTSTFSSRVEILPKFDFSGSPALKRDESLLFIGLEGLGGSVIGLAFFPRPLLSSRLEETHDLARRILNLLLLAAVILSCLALIRWKRFGGLIRVVIASALLWIVRYVLIWINFPAGYVTMGIFDPIYFASPFGFGLAKSIGDLWITSMFLLCNVLLLVSWAVRSFHRLEETKIGLTKGRRLLALCLLPLLALIVSLFLRGFAALVRSAMFDSGLEYNDPTFVIPSTELAVMLVSLLLAAVALVAAGSAVIDYSALIARGRAKSGGPTFGAWLIVVLVLATVSILFGILQQNPLMGQIERLAYLTGLIALAVVISWRVEASSFIWSAPYLALLAVAAVLALIPQLDGGTHELDRNHVELLANEIARPADTWLRLVANQALDELSGPEAAEILVSADSDDIAKLAFTKWAKSILSREGYNCAVTYVDQIGNVVSDFHIGTTPHPSGGHRGGLAATDRSVHVEERSVGGTVVKWYIAFSPFLSDSGDLLGGVRVELSGGKQAMLRGEAPEFLRSHSRENFERHYRTLILSEYFQGRLVSSTGETIALDRPLPDILSSRTSGGAGMWLDENIDGATYESYFLPEQAGGSNDAWIALSLESLGLRWHLYSFLRYLLFFGLLGASGFLLLLVARFKSGWRFTPTFRSKLFAAFVVVSLLPVAILAYYNREYASERIQENTIEWLNNQTSIVVAEIQRQLGISIPVVLSQLTDERCAEVAADLNTDFVVYRGTTVQASSKPEMFEAELLDRNLSAEAYLNSVLKKRSFFAENQMIGKLPYVVGYRPIVAENGSIIGVASVPTLYRQMEVNAELTRRDVFLYGAYAVALAFSLLVGTLFASQISSPIRRLKKAAQQVARGSLEVELGRQRRDELGDLEQAFGEMVGDLKRTQEQMIRAQRELAWREMAKQIAHEIKNPLTPMKLSIQHLRQAYRDGAKDFANILKSISETLLLQIETLSKIATEFSYFARMPERKLELCNVHDVLVEARDLYGQDGKITFRADLGVDRPLVTADREELRRVFINILRNAVQAMEQGGTVSLTTRREGGDILIEIADDGPGIPPEVQSRLFEPNFSTKTDGMGLGLAIVKKIVDDLGGSIRVESGTRSGTAVTIRLPLARETEISGSSSERPSGHDRD